MYSVAVLCPEVQQFEIVLNEDCCEDVWRSVNPEAPPAVIYKPGGCVEGYLSLMVTQPLKLTGK